MHIDSIAGISPCLLVKNSSFLLGVPPIDLRALKNALRFENLTFSNLMIGPLFRSPAVLYRCNNVGRSAVRNRRSRSHFDSGAIAPPETKSLAGIDVAQRTVHIAPADIFHQGLGAPLIARGPGGKTAT